MAHKTPKIGASMPNGWVMKTIRRQFYKDVFFSSHSLIVVVVVQEKSFHETWCDGSDAIFEGKTRYTNTGITNNYITDGSWWKEAKKVEEEEKKKKKSVLKLKSVYKHLADNIKLEIFLFHLIVCITCVCACFFLFSILYILIRSVGAVVRL